MPKYNFGAWVDFGGSDIGETEFDLDLTEEEVERMEALRNTLSYFRDEFCDSEDLRDIYQKAYEVAVEQITQEQLEFSEYEPDWDEEEHGRPWRVDDTFFVTVTVPWQNDLADGEE